MRRWTTIKLSHAVLQGSRKEGEAAVAGCPVHESLLTAQPPPSRLPLGLSLTSEVLESPALSLFCGRWKYRRGEDARIGAVVAGEVGKHRTQASVSKCLQMLWPGVCCC